jgi:long-chain acyl-CoA synthetase
MIYCGVEVLFQRLADFPDVEKYHLGGKLGLCVSGAGPLHSYVREAFEAKVPGARLVEGYGLTEASPVVCAGPFYGKNKPGSIGLPFVGTDCKIVDIATGEQELPPGPDNVGELIVHGPQVMKGYLRQDDEGRDLREIDGKIWLYTGDLGYMDEEGSIFLCDRKKQLIKHKGYSVFPKEVETLVGQHPAIKEVAAAGIPDRTTNEQIKAWVVLKPEFVGKVTEEEIKDWCKQNITHYKVPRYIEFRDSLPCNAVGKVMRRELQENDPLYIEYYKQK